MDETLRYMNNFIVTPNSQINRITLFFPVFSSTEVFFGTLVFLFFFFFKSFFFPFKFFYSNTNIININNMKNNYMNQLLKYTLVFLILSVICQIGNPK